MKKVIFVCTGNACRSPFAECVMRVLLEQEGLHDYEVSSMGTLDWGKNSRDEGMVAVASGMGYCLTGETTPVTYEALQQADQIIVFTQRHRDRITRILDYDRWNRIILFDKLAFGTDDEVLDPSFQTEAVYRYVASHIEEGCKRIVSLWKNKG